MIVAEQFFVEPDADRPEILVRGDGLTIAERILPSDASWTHISSLAVLGVGLKRCRGDTRTG